MLDRDVQKALREQEKFFGISPGFKIYSALPFSGINQQSSRQGIKDEEFFWLENFINIGQTNLRTLWDKGNPIYSASNGLTIVYFFFYNIATTNYVVVFLSDGTAVQINTLTGASTVISSVLHTFYSGGQLPACGQWGSLYLLIANNITANSYWVWDGMNLFTSGGIGPQVTITNSGSGYTSPPTVTAFGGSGTGATFSASINNGNVVAVQVTNPGTGYVVGDQPQLVFTGGGSDSGIELTATISASGTVTAINITNGGINYTSPIVTITGGGGSGATANATVSVGSNGHIASITVTNPGSGYSSTPTVTITDGGSGSLATAVAVLGTGGVTGVTVVNGGTNLIGTPAITFVGGNGTGAVANAVITSGTITSVNVSNPGTGYTTVPAVVAASGQNHAASATITIMPFGISGTAIETFESRVWITSPHQSGTQNNGGIFNVSAPESFSDFATSDGGDTFTSTDAFLRAQYTNIKQSNGYLYPIGDSSVSVISNVQSGGNPIETSFNYQNTDPQIGTSWRDSVAPYSTTILFGNQFGIYGVYGGKATKISGKIDTIFNNAVFPQNGGVVPSSAIANIFAQKVYLLLITLTDPFTFSPRDILLGWDEKQWFVASQSGIDLNFIATQEVNSNCTAWGTDGNALYPLFNYPSSNLTKTISTKLYGQQNFLIQKQSMGVYLQVQDLSPNTTGVSFNTFTVDSETGSYPIPNDIVAPSCPQPYYATISTGAGDTFGVNLGMTMTTTSQDFSLSFLGLGYIETGSIAMSSTAIQGQIDTE